MTRPVPLTSDQEFLGQILAVLEEIRDRLPAPSKLTISVSPTAGQQPAEQPAARPVSTARGRRSTTKGGGK